MRQGHDLQIKGQDIRAIVFDLDGTLYVSELFEHAVWESVSCYAGELLGCTPTQGGEHLTRLREQLTAERGTVQTLAATIQVMGGTVQEMHRRFALELEPGGMIVPDSRVAPLIQNLAGFCRCWLLTNNNRPLTDKILSVLGLSALFERVITIDETWRPKPDQSLLDDVLAALALPPENVLFVGDRYDIDLRLPEQAGCPVLLTRSVEDLILLETLSGTEKQ